MTISTFFPEEPAGKVACILKYVPQANAHYARAHTHAVDPFQDISLGIYFLV